MSNSPILVELTIKKYAIRTLVVNSRCICMYHVLQDYGAGSTRPFPPGSTSGSPVNGDYSDWSEWSQCSKTCDSKFFHL